MLLSWTVSFAFRIKDHMVYSKEFRFRILSHTKFFSYMFDIVAMIELHGNSGFKRTHRHPQLSWPFGLR